MCHFICLESSAVSHHSWIKTNENIETFRNDHPPKIKGIKCINLENRDSGCFKNMPFGRLDVRLHISDLHCLFQETHLCLFWWHGRITQKAIPSFSNTVTHTSSVHFPTSPFKTQKNKQLLYQRPTHCHIRRLLHGWMRLNIMYS